MDVGCLQRYRKRVHRCVPGGAISNSATKRTIKLLYGCPGWLVGLHHSLLFTLVCTIPSWDQVLIGALTLLQGLVPMWRPVDLFRGPHPGTLALKACVLPLRQLSPLELYGPRVTRIYKLHLSLRYADDQQKKALHYKHCLSSPTNNLLVREDKQCL